MMVHVEAAMKPSDQPVRSILFVCTGNILRSVVAEHATKLQQGSNHLYSVGSAGIEAKPQTIHPWIQHYLWKKGVDLSQHVQRKLTRELLEETDLVLAMSRDHQTFIRQEFGIGVPLFRQICAGRDEPILDLHEVHPNWEQDLSLARTYVSSVIDMIWDDVRLLLSKLPHIR
jgi:protein-tyrosine phosphatase